MPKGEPNKHTLRVDRYQKKTGYKVKSFKLKGDIAEKFTEACERAGVSQASQITKMMQEFIEKQNAPISFEDMANTEDLAAHDAAMREYRAGETVPHDAVDWN